MAGSEHRTQASDTSRDSPKSKSAAKVPLPRQAPRPSVVAIGASAGGLAALKLFFAKVPATSGLAYVVVMHLAPEHESHLADLLQPSANIPVQQVTEDVALEPDRVYVIPPGSNLSSIDTHLRLSDLEKSRRERAPIDHFFKTLAETHDGHAIGVVLTGTGSDGALGLRKIKNLGGLTIIQDPNEAEYSGMPRSALATGLVDLVLPVEEIPQAIRSYVATEPDLDGARNSDDLEEAQRRLLQTVFSQVQSRTGRDFSRYKQSTILRRISRRMQLEQIEKLEDYVGLLRRNASEVQALADEFLITVTEFFRDPQIYARLEEDIIPALFTDKGPDDVIRVWSVGCSTGEEAYSIAMLLQEERSKHGSPPRLQVFASDLHEHSLKTARSGYYPETISENVSPERLSRFFIKEDGGYTVRPDLREIVLFTQHNLLSDAPFSRLDMITCRNVLIYLQRGAQADVMDVFHYSLNANGILLLGTSETVERSDFFQLESKEHSVYRKKDAPTGNARLPVFAPTLPFAAGGRRAPARANDTASYGVAHETIVEQYAPPSVLIGADDKVLHLSKGAGRYLVHPGGVPTNEVSKLIREELRMELSTSLHSARQEREPVRTRAVPMMLGSDHREVTIDVRPAATENGPGPVLLIFDERPPAEPLSDSPDDTTNTRERDLQRELDLARKRLQSVMDEHNTNQEEMWAGNEELQSMNEELRSALEELETSKEELQSMNEELVTVNQENRHKMEELAQVSADLQNLLSSTEIATIFLDRELRILRYTPRVEEIFNIRGNDRGRPLADLTNRLGYPTLISDAKQVLASLERVEREAESAEGHWFLIRLLPYRSIDDRIEGVIINFVDISERRQAEQNVRELNLRLEQKVDDRTKQLKASNDELEAFNYSVSHDLRAPLRGIDGFAQVLLEEYGDKLDETGQGYLNRVRAGAARMGDLIDDLLELSRISSGMLRREPVDMADIAREIAASLRESYDDSTVDFSVGDELAVSGDASLLRIALENLLANAWKFTKNGQTAHVEFGSEQHGDQRVYFVRDNGIGFDMRYAGRLFTPFQRLHPERPFSGTGVGLSLVHRIISRHGGKLWADGTPDKGSTFYFTLPPAEENEGEQRVELPDKQTLMSEPSETLK
ncbi:MAG TPA: chemotaxis protein CheB [Trueperaceae bacterium]